MFKTPGLSYAGWGLLVGSLPWLYPAIVTRLARYFPQAPPELPGWMYGFSLTIAVVLMGQALATWWRSAQPSKHPEGWAITEAILQPLVRQGWTIQQRVSVNGGSNFKKTQCLDLLIQSPQKNYYCVSIQPHRGKIDTDGRTIFRVYDHSKRPFETDLLGMIRQQASTVKTRYQLSSTPILIFPEAIVAVQENPVAGVHITGRLTLRSCLLQLDQAKERNKTQ